MVKVLPEHKADLKEFAFVSIVKFVLTEGEKFIIFAFRDFVSTSWKNKFVGSKCTSGVRLDCKLDFHSMQICVLAHRRDCIQPLLKVQERGRQSTLRPCKDLSVPRCDRPWNGGLRKSVCKNVLKTCIHWKMGYWCKRHVSYYDSLHVRLWGLTAFIPALWHSTELRRLTYMLKQTNQS